MGLGNSLYADGDKRAAAEAFRAAAQAHHSAAAWINLAGTLVELGAAADAVQAAREAVATGDPLWQVQAQAALQSALRAAGQGAAPPS
jgi:uncharacterized protein HemY